MSASSLVKSVSITNLVNKRTVVVERMRQALDLISEAEQLAKAAHVGFPRLVIDNSYSLRGRTISISGDFSNRADVEVGILKTVDTPAWQYLLHESGLRTFMDASAREKWDKQISTGEIPPLTLDNIEATFEGLHKARGEMFERGVIACFRRLSWSYKTNQPCKFGKRLIVNGLFSYGTPNHRTTDELDDLMRVFHVIDGKPEADHRNGIYALVSGAWQRRESEAGNDYMRIKWFKKGTGHVFFKRPDLVDKMNMILAKHYPDALPSDLR
ncbi:DUF4942 domain-containing protein [Methylobacter sp.]|uniref:DUF4942 domain-containing protein n=1 Tax=Methylobacter sp. TaxID=2051955 RepID=UPI003DA28DC4